MEIQLQLCDNENDYAKISMRASLSCNMTYIKDHIQIKFVCIRKFCCFKGYDT